MTTVGGKNVAAAIIRFGVSTSERLMLGVSMTAAAAITGGPMLTMIGACQPIWPAGGRAGVAFQTMSHVHRGPIQRALHVVVLAAVGVGDPPHVHAILAHAVGYLAGIWVVAHGADLVAFIDGDV